jgi:Lrp/AsnC family transcriptional regulator, leucine-responsive regulatory protein
MSLLDAVDLKILDSLQSNGRIRRNDLAEIVGLSLPSVSERMRKLEEAGYITGYFARLDAKKLGKDIMAFIFVYVDSSKHYQAFLEHTESNEEIVECHAVTGEGSHLLKIRTENTASLERLLGKIQTWHGVSGTRTHLVLSTSKESTRVKLPPPK